jgi:hypothetical protein
MNLELTPEEQAIMTRLLEAALGETRVEIHRTHYSPSFRDELKRDEGTIRGLLDKVRHKKP